MSKPSKALIAALVFVVSLLGQAQQPALKPSTKDRTPEPSPSLVLEVRYNPETPPAYLDVRGPSEKPTWLWVTRFVRTVGALRSPEDSPVRAVKFETQFNGETTDVRVTVFRGNMGFDREDLVCQFKLGVGEHRLISELRLLQIEPIDITISDTPYPLPSAPAFELRTSAVEVVSTELESQPLPAYRIKFRNITQKNISALQIGVIDGVVGLPQGIEGRPLMAPGAVHEEYVPLSQSISRSGVSQAHTVIVSSVVFEDGSYEGAVEPACMLESFQMGRAVWLKSVLPLMDEQMKQVDTQAWVGATQLKQRITELSPVVPNELANRSSRVSPSCSAPGLQTETVFNGQRLQLLRDLDQLISTRPAPPIDFNVWLRSKRDAYANWLSRLTSDSVK